MMYFDQFKSIAKPLLLAGSTLLAVMVLTATAAASKPAAAPVYEIAQSGGFSQEERRIIYDVLDAVDRNIGDDENRGKGGKSKDNGKDGLPPGIAKRDLPADFQSRLPYRSDAIRQIVGNDVVLIEKGTDIILDVIRDVVRN
ncbi:hypothetical protein [Thalassospira xiamenensis]|uniref:hypothetical protein n=1 Tax=Thalassospira xiamenensis TaxID=220697 RepID=UPI00215D624D|nr:hypothetical protein [Thalassospira xiamenensis]